MDINAYCQLALRELPGVGERTLTRLVDLVESRSENLRAILDASPDQLSSVYRLRPQTIARLAEQRARHFQRCDWLESELQRIGGELLTPRHPVFPPHLQQNLHRPPPMLFTVGNVGLLASPCIAILSSREIASQTVPATVAVLRVAMRESFAVAIGGMKTTHRLTNIMARAIGLPRIVVLDRGLFAAFASDYSVDPFGSGKRRVRFDPDSTLVVSPFRPEDHAAPNNGRRRDEIIAALGTLLFASSARPGGEVERICLDAIARGRCVLTWPGGSRKLLAAGATRVTPRLLELGLKQLLASAPAPAPRPPLPESDRRSKSRGA